MEKVVLTAMEITKGHSRTWWNDELVSAVVEAGVKVGWLNRPAVSQVEWTQKGADAIKRWQESPRS